MQKAIHVITVHSICIAKKLSAFVDFMCTLKKLKANFYKLRGRHLCLVANIQFIAGEIVSAHSLIIHYTAIEETMPQLRRVST
jgi:hypothetical protein